MPDNREPEKLSLLYSEVTKVATTFWEWRDKVMTRFFTVITAAMIVAGWFYQHSELKPWVFAPFALAALFSVLSDIMDRVNTRILWECCYPVGMSIEQKLSSDEGIFKAIQDTRKKRVSYHRILRVMYIGSTCFFLIVAILVAIYVR